MFTLNEVKDNSRINKKLEFSIIIVLFLKFIIEYEIIFRIKSYN
jgi:hypothetical protein